LFCLELLQSVNLVWLRLLAAYPIGMGLSLIYLGEHYLIDILLGWAYAAAAIYLVNLGFERWAARATRLRHQAAATSGGPAQVATGYALRSKMQPPGGR
jgi:membrane-associated phospholipid phosphatase